MLSTGGGNIITGNLIGTDLDGFTPLGNGGFGMGLEKNESISPIPNTIGPDNIIAYNGAGGDGPGIELMSGMLNTIITENSIFENGGRESIILKMMPRLSHRSLFITTLKKG